MHLLNSSTYTAYSPYFAERMEHKMRGGLEKLADICLELTFQAITYTDPRRYAAYEQGD